MDVFQNSLFRNSSDAFELPELKCAHSWVEFHLYLHLGYSRLLPHYFLQLSQSSIRLEEGQITGLSMDVIASTNIADNDFSKVRSCRRDMEV